MVEYVYSLQAEYSGPFLIGRDKFLELDGILTGLWQNLDAQRQLQIAEKTQAYVNETIADRIESARSIFSGAELEKRLKEYQGEESRKKLADGYIPGLNGLRFSERKVSANCGEGKTIEGQTVKEIDNQLTLDGLSPRIVGVWYHCGNIAFSFTVTSGGESTIRIAVTPERGEPSHEVFLALRTWAESVRPNSRVRLWTNEVIRFLALAFLALLAYGVVSILFDRLTGESRKATTDDISARIERLQEQQNKDREHKAVAVEEARTLIAAGITPANQSEALRILLSLETSSYPTLPANNSPAVGPPAPMPQVQSRSAVVKIVQSLFVALFGISLIVGFPPKTRLGLGAGQGRLERTRKWINFVTVSLPAWVVASFVLPWLSKIAQAVLS